jgi:hypothetical protein
MSDLDFSFKHPTTIQVSGPSRCGKTRLVLRILEKQVIHPFPTRILWVYSEWQKDYKEAAFIYPHIEFVQGWQDDIYDRIKPNERNLLIVDDQMDEAGSSKTLTKLFTKGSHHRNLTILYLLQNMYNSGSSQRTVSLNSHYNVVFRNSRDASQFRTLAHQMHPGNAKWLIQAFDDATSEPYGYLVLDHHPESDKDKRVVSKILPGEQLTIYQAKNIV